MVSVVSPELLPKSEYARLLYAGGVAYYEAALLIDSHPANEGRVQLILPTHNAVGVSIEMLFKALLSHKGLSAACLKNSKLGHNLRALSTKAQEQNFITSIIGINEIIDCIGSDYANNNFRYMKENSSVKTVNVADALKAVDQFIDEIAIMVGLPLRPESN